MNIIPSFYLVAIPWVKKMPENDLKTNTKKLIKRIWNTLIFVHSKLFNSLSRVIPLFVTFFHPEFTACKLYQLELLFSLFYKCTTWTTICNPQSKTLQTLKKMIFYKNLLWYLKSWFVTRYGNDDSNLFRRM